MGTRVFSTSRLWHTVLLRPWGLPVSFPMKSCGFHGYVPRAAIAIARLFPTYFVTY